VPEIPDDVVNFFNNCHSSAVHRSDDDVGLLLLDSETTVVGHPTTNSHADGGNVTQLYHLCKKHPNKFARN